MVECLTTATGVLDYWHKTFFGFFPIYFLWQRHWSHLSLSFPLSLDRSKQERDFVYFAKLLSKMSLKALLFSLQSNYRSTSHSTQVSQSWLCLPSRILTNRSQCWLSAWLQEYMNSNELLLTARGTILVGNMGDHTDSNSHCQVFLMTFQRASPPMEHWVLCCSQVAEREGISLGLFWSSNFLFFLSPPGGLQISAVWSLLAPSTPWSGAPPYSRCKW